jgi:hypothetical protein
MGHYNDMTFGKTGEIASATAAWESGFYFFCAANITGI